MARQRWNVLCTAHRSTDGLPCEAYSVRGLAVCISHGGATRRARAAAEIRLAKARFYLGIARDIAKAIERERNMTPQQRQVRNEAILDLARTMLPPPKPRKRVSPPLYDPETGISWSLIRWPRRPTSRPPPS
jgi:hypothetical protein